MHLLTVISEASEMTFAFILTGLYRELVDTRYSMRHTKNFKALHVKNCLTYQEF